MINTRLVVAAFTLALAGSATAAVYSDDFSNVVLGSSLGLSGNGIANGQCSELTCNSNYYFVDSIPGWSFSDAVYDYAYNAPIGNSNLGLGDSPYNSTAILLNENGLGQIATASNTISGLTAGQTYDLTFKYWGDNVPYGPTGQTYSFLVGVNGQNTLFQDVQNSGLGSGNFNTGTIAFVATGSSASLSFTQQSPAFDSGTLASPIIGSVDINAATTPEPGFYGLLALGLAGLVTVVSRRKTVKA